ncbi:MAG TPA: hypothetical protein VH281_11050 [Gaiellaceae bacterium]
MHSVLTYDLMLEPAGILRSEDVRTEFERELEPGETIALHGRRWLVTDVQSSPGGEFDRRAVAREVADEDDL